MTPSEIELMARRRYNAVNDTFYAQQEIFDYIYAACSDVADETHAIERIYESTTSSGTQAYDYPTNAISIKRATWNGRKLTKIDMLEDDVLTGLNQNTTETGDPEYYWTWDKTIYLRPVPSSAQTLELWTLNTPAQITSPTATVELPLEHHFRLITYVLACMAEKDKNYAAADRLWLQWHQKEKLEIRKSIAKNKRTDKFASVKDESMMVETTLSNG